MEAHSVPVSRLLFQSSLGTYRSLMGKFTEKFEDKPELSADVGVTKATVTSEHLTPAQTSILSQYEKYMPKCESIYTNQSKGVSVFKVTLACAVEDSKDPAYGYKEFVLKSTKLYPKEQRGVDNLTREYHIGKAFGLYCRNVARVLDMRTKKCQDGGRVVEVLSEYGGKSLHELRNTLGKGDVVQIMFQLLSALVKMEEIGVAHLDIKPQNLVWDPATRILKIIDFGSSISMYQSPGRITKTIDAFHARQVNGCTLYFAPPEVLQEVMDSKSFIPQKVDLFCFGITFITMLLYEHKKDISTLLDRGKTKKELDEYMRSVMETLDSLGECAWIGPLCCCLAYDPNERPTFLEIQKMFTEIAEGLHLDLIRPTTVESEIDEKKLGDTYANMGEYNVAVQFYNKALDKKCYRSKGELGVIYLRLGEFYNALNQPSNAVLCLEKLNIFISDECNEYTAVRYFELGRAYNDLADFDRAIEHYSKALRNYTEIYGAEGDQMMAEIHEHLGVAYTLLHKDEIAIAHYKQMLSITEKFHGKLSSETAVAYGVLAARYAATRDHDEAMKCSSEAMRIEALINMSDDKSQHFEIEYFDFGCMHESLHEYDKAKKFFLQSLEAGKKTIGEENPNFKTTYFRLAKVCYVLGNFGESIKFYLLALEVCKTDSYGEAGCDTADIYSSLGMTYYIQGKHGNAVSVWSKAAEIYRKFPTKTKFAKTHLLLAYSYEALGKYEFSMQCLSKALGSIEGAYVKGDEEYCRWGCMCSGLGQTYYKSGKFEEAAVCHEKALQMYKAGYKDQSNRPDLIESLTCLASIYDSRRKYEAEIPCLNQVLDILRKTHGDTHLDVADVYNKLGDAYLSSGKKEESAKYYTRAVEICKDLPVTGDLTDLDLLRELSIAYNGMDKSAEALEVFLRILKILKRTHGKVHADVGKAYKAIGALCFYLGRYDKALHYLGKTEKIMKHLLGSSHEDLAPLYGFEAEMCDKLQDSDKANEFRAMALSLRHQR